MRMRGIEWRFMAAVVLVLAGTLRAEDVKPQPPPATEDKPAVAAAKIEFLDGDAGKAAIVDDQSEPYFSRLQTLEMSVKTSAKITGATLDEQRAETRKRYQAEVKPFTDAEKKNLTAIIEALQPVLAKDYPLYARTPWSFIKLGAKVEGGLPHTRGTHIVLPAPLLESMPVVKADDPKEKQARALLPLYMLLLHEQTHVIQRAHPDLFVKLFKEVWGFEHTKQIEPGPWLTARSLANPDGVDVGWVMPLKDGDKTSYIWPLVILGRLGDDVQMPDDFAEVCIELEKKDDGFAVQLPKPAPEADPKPEKPADPNEKPAAKEDKKDDKAGMPVIEQLSKTSEYLKKFPVRQELFHPNEISAVMFSRVVFFDSFLPKDRISPEQSEKFDKNFGTFRTWAKDAFK